jgi:serine/threonine-protein kinase
MKFLTCKQFAAAATPVCALLPWTRFSAAAALAEAGSMTDMASTSPAAQSPRPPAEAGKPDPSPTPPSPGSSGGAADDQMTIISSRPPMTVPPVSDAVSDSAARILQGRILPGDHLGHFELVQYVGGGGMGRVFRALDTRLARTVALKVLAPDQAADRDTLLRFQNEAQSAARLDHDNIARVYYVGEDRGLHYIVFEFIAGVNIRELVEAKGPLTLADAISYTLQAAEALAHAARRNVVHRDIKPSNLLITPEGQVKLIDMGLARLREVNSAAADLTASGITLGTFDYISPEQARDPRNADIRSDLYSLGCTFFYMLTGRPPFPRGTVLQKLLQHQGDQPPDVRQFRPELPEAVSRVLRRAMAKDPRHRYADAAEMAAELTALAREAGIHPGSAAGKGWIAAERPAAALVRRHLPWVAPLAALLGIVLLLNRVWAPPANQEVLPPAIEEAPQPAQPTPETSNPAAARQAGAGLPVRAEESGKQPPSEKSRPAAVAGGEEAPLPPESRPTAGPLDRPGFPAAESVDDSGRVNPWKALTPGIAQLSPGDAAGLASGDGLVGPQTALPALSDPAGGGTSAFSGVIQDGTLTLGGGGNGGLPAPGTPSAAPAKHTGKLIVDRRSGEGTFASLGAACTAAVNGDVIELRFDGPLQEQPIRLANLRVTIRAGEGHRPLLVFRPTEPDPVKCPRSMVTATAGRLTLIGVAIELQVPRAVPADQWSLLETRGDATVRLEHCALVIDNASEQLGAYHQDVAFVRTRAVPGADTVLGDGTAALVPPAMIELVDCTAAGEAVFLRAEDLQPVHLSWNNGLLATTERLLSAGGGARTPQAGQSLQVDLRHLTALVRGGLCRIAGSPTGPHFLPLQCSCTDSILLGRTGSPLIEQTGQGEVDDIRQQIVWSGDRNCYDGFDVFWSIDRHDGEAPPERMDFAAWKSHWAEQENLPRSGAVAWRKLPAADRPLHGCTPADFALDEAAAGNAALGAASDGGNIGLQADRLLPAAGPPAAAKEKEPKS